MVEEIQTALTKDFVEIQLFIEHREHIGGIDILFQVHRVFCGARIGGTQQQTDIQAAAADVIRTFDRNR